MPFIGLTFKLAWCINTRSVEKKNKGQKSWRLTIGTQILAIKKAQEKMALEQTFSKQLYSNTRVTNEHGTEASMTGQ